MRKFSFSVGNTPYGKYINDYSSEMQCNTYNHFFLLPRIDIFHMRSGYGHAIRLNPLSATLLLRYLDVWDIGNGQLIS